MTQKPSSPSPMASSEPNASSVTGEPWWFAELEVNAQIRVRELFVTLQEELKAAREEAAEHKRAAERFASDLADCRIRLDRAKRDLERSVPF